ncbi:hypothetical protein DSO57_1031249 [Entomophthora muscae]|uniref:Uncharacterized protein n=1 Tax=Entomophthora muscae TaxID=34485 RepID=A0ACC2TYM0_9FUNG|nr:hypothetical protein DSO57_1031249 [Entomophthora muscae]
MKLLSLTVLIGLAFGRGSRSQNQKDDTRVMWCLLNFYRDDNGMPPMYLDDRLMEAAYFHSEDQANMGRMSHQGSRGSNFQQRVRRASYPVTSGAENVAWGQRDVTAVMEAWVNSPGHEANILSRNRCFGYGESNRFWTQLFSSGDDCTESNLPDCSDFE